MLKIRSCKKCFPSHFSPSTTVTWRLNYRVLWELQSCNSLCRYHHSLSCTLKTFLSWEPVAFGRKCQPFELHPNLEVWGGGLLTSHSVVIATYKVSHTDTWMLMDLVMKHSKEFFPLIFYKLKRDVSKVGGGGGSSQWWDKRNFFFVVVLIQRH